MHKTTAKIEHHTDHLSPPNRHQLPKQASDLEYLNPGNLSAQRLSEESLKSRRNNFKHELEPSKPIDIVTEVASAFTAESPEVSPPIMEIRKPILQEFPE